MNAFLLDVPCIPRISFLLSRPTSREFRYGNNTLISIIASLSIIAFLFIFIFWIYHLYINDSHLFPLNIISRSLPHIFEGHNNARFLVLHTSSHETSHPLPRKSIRMISQIDLSSLTTSCKPSNFLGTYLNAFANFFPTLEST